MSENESPARLTKLSELQVGTLYHVTADDVDLHLQVVTPGPAPLCVIRGDLGDISSSEDDSLSVIQLIGWNTFNVSMLGEDGLTYFVADEQPDYANLLGLYYKAERPSGLEQIIVACAPTITPIS